MNAAQNDFEDLTLLKILHPSLGSLGTTSFINIFEWKSVSEQDLRIDRNYNQIDQQECFPSSSFLLAAKKELFLIEIISYNQFYIHHKPLEYVQGKSDLWRSSL